jgi:four helix bundle protein
MRQDLRARTKRFALAVVRVAGLLDRHPTGRLLVSQLLRSGTSVGANYRAACRAKSRADFVSKLSTAEEECDETSYWLELFLEVGAIPPAEAEPLLDEAGQLTAIFVASIRTARGGRRSGT